MSEEEALKRIVQMILTCYPSLHMDLAREAGCTDAGDTDTWDLERMAEIFLTKEECKEYFEEAL